MRPQFAACLYVTFAFFTLLHGAHAQSSITKPCRIEGFKNEVQCGSIKRPLDPASPQGVQIEIHYVVIPAVARNKLEDAIFYFEGGPGGSAIKAAPMIMARLGRLNSRRDVVFVDQRGTGKSAPLECKPSESERLPTLTDLTDNEKMVERLKRCQTELEALPYGKDGGLRFFYSELALKDADAVRAALGYEKINLIGGSYGSRAALEYMRQFPSHVRRSVIDGIAPPDMVLPQTVGIDIQSAWDKLLDDCEKDEACTKRYPKLRAQAAALVASLPKDVSAINPATGRQESFTLTRMGLASSMRLPLYAPSIAATLPFVIAEASEGRYTPLVGISSAMWSGGPDRMALGMHMSVICAEDFPRMTTPATTHVTALFGDQLANFYKPVCPGWFGANKPVVPDAFYAVPPATFPTLVLSGGADPVTPPRHGEYVAKSLGAKARHIVAPQVGHIVMFQGCARDMVMKFIDTKDDEQALKLDEACIAKLQKLPRASVYLPPALFSGTQNQRASTQIQTGVQ